MAIPNKLTTGASAKGKTAATQPPALKYQEQSIEKSEVNGRGAEI